MIVLRLTAGDASQEVRTPLSEVVLGSDPAADITLPNVGLAARALRLRLVDSEVEVEVLDSDRRLRMRVGDEIEVNGVHLALVGLVPASSDLPAMFGGYEDDPIVQRQSRPTFELADAGPEPELFGRKTAPPPLPRADASPKSPPPDRASRTTTSKPTTKSTPASTSSTKAPPPRVTSSKTTAKGNVELKPLKFPDPNFGTELLIQLKRSPFFALSLGLHLLIFFAMTLFETTPSERLETGLGAMSASLDAADEDLSFERSDERDDGLQLREPEMPELAEFVPEDEPQPPPQTQPPPPSPFRETQPEDDRRPLEIGIMPGLSAARAKVPGKKPKLKKADLKRDFKRGTAGSSNQRSAEIVRGQLGRGRGDHASLQDLMREDILVVDGSFDHIEKVLDALHIKYVKKSPWALSSPVVEDFKSYKVVFWNCGEALTQRRIGTVAKHLKTFVRNGGYLFTTDWGVATVLQATFPGYLRSNGNRAHLPEMTLPIEAAASARDHPLLEGVFLPNVQGKWWLEQASFDVSVGRADKVTVLIESPMLRDTFNRSPVVAATFHYGRGRVLHTMGHYYQEAGNLAGTISAHRLALNFVLLRLDQDRNPRRR